MSFRIVRTTHLTPHERDELLALCRAAYDEELADYLDAAGPGVHLLGRLDDRLVSHVMLVERALQPEGLPPLRTGYVELVATHPELQGRGYASTLMREVPALLAPFELGALAPSDPAF